MTLIERLEKVAAERATATANDSPGNYLLVVARLSHEDAKLLQEAADRIRELEASMNVPDLVRVHRALELYKP